MAREIREKLQRRYSVVAKKTKCKGQFSMNCRCTRWVSIPHRASLAYKMGETRRRGRRQNSGKRGVRNLKERGVGTIKKTNQKPITSADVGQLLKIGFFLDTSSFLYTSYFYSDSIEPLFNPYLFFSLMFSCGW